MSPDLPRTVVTLSSNAVARRLGSGGVVVNLRTNAIFELNDTGMRIWELFGAGLPPDEVARTLTAEFHVDERTAAIECNALLTRLREEGLVE